MPSALVNVTIGAVLKAGKGLVRDFGEVDRLQVSRKGTADFVTNADTRVEQYLQRELSKARPDFGFLLEEGGEIAGKDGTHRWVIDPIDGTHNLIHAIPYFCVSVGVEHTSPAGRSRIIAGVIFDPIHNELFYAEKNGGAYLNDRRINVSARTTMEESLLATGKPVNLQNDQNTIHDSLTRVIKNNASLRQLGATALDLAYVAAGRIDGCWYHSVRPWDLAAGMLLIEEAGGTVTDINGDAATIHCDNLIASNGYLHTKLRNLVHPES